MKLTAINVDSFMKLREIAVELTHPVTLFAGDNDVGKSSLQEAIRLAFTGETVRVEHKKDYPSLVRDGGKAATILVEFEHGDKPGRAGGTIPPGKMDANMALPEALPYVLDAPRFAGLEEKDRRKFLFELMRVRSNLEAIKERLRKKGARDDLIEIIVPILRTGWPAAESYANTKQTEWRGTWKGITGEMYGEVKAKTWEAPLSGEEVNKDALKGIDHDIAELHRDHDQVMKQIGAGEAYLKNKARYDAESAGLRDKSQNVARLKLEVEQLDTSIVAQRGKAETLRADLERARVSGQPCPACGTVLHVLNGKFVEAHGDGEKLGEMETALQQADTALRALENTRRAKNTEYEAAIQAAQQLAALEKAMGSPTDEAKLRGLRDSATGLSEDIQALTDRRTELAQQHAAIEAAKKKTEDAKRAHESVLAWTLIRELMSPDGIQSELLEEAMGPINARLEQTAKATGWPTVKILADTSVTIGGLPYRLCGESSRWRADASIAEAVSNAAGLGLLVLDRIDVLSVPNRGRLLDWCDALIEDGYGSIVLFGTLKEKPAMDGVNVFWLKDGRVA